MRIFSKSALRDFWEAHANSEIPLRTWYKSAVQAEWSSPNDIKTLFPNASILYDNRIVFNIKGNEYRLVVRMDYEHQMIFIRFVGTHAEYDKINAETI